MLCDILKMEIMRFTLYLIGVGNIPSKFKQKMSKNSDQLSTGCQQGVWWVDNHKKTATVYIVMESFDFGTFRSEERFHAEQLPYPAGRLRCRL